MHSKEEQKVKPQSQREPDAKPQSPIIVQQEEIKLNHPQISRDKLENQSRQRPKIDQLDIGKVHSMVGPQSEFVA